MSVYLNKRVVIWVAGTFFLCLYYVRSLHVLSMIDTVLNSPKGKNYVQVHLYYVYRDIDDGNFYNETMAMPGAVLLCLLAYKLLLFLPQFDKPKWKSGLENTFNRSGLRACFCVCVV